MAEENPQKVSKNAENDLFLMQIIIETIIRDINTE
jgi:hypothetical protein